MSTLAKIITGILATTLFGVLVFLYFNLFGVSTPKNLSATNNQIIKAEDSNVVTADGYFYVCMDHAVVYNDSVSKKVAVQLTIGDSVQLIMPRKENDIVFGYCQTNTMYQIAFWHAGQNMRGYIKGSFLGNGIHYALDHDGTQEILAAHYLHYNPGDDLAKGQAEIVVIKNSRIICKSQFESYSSIFVEPVDSSTAFQGYDFFMVHYGVEACDYPNGEVLIYYHDHKLDSISHVVISGGEDGGTSISYLFPQNKGGKKNSILLVAKTGYNLENMDSTERIGLHDFIDTTEYHYSGGRFKRM